MQLFHHLDIIHSLLADIKSFLYMKRQICYLLLKEGRKKRERKTVLFFSEPWQHLRVEKSQRHFSSRKERNRREYPRLNLLPAMNFPLKKIRHRLQYPPPRGPTSCTREELMAVRRNLMHPRVAYTWLYRCLSRVVVQLHIYTIHLCTYKCQ